MYCPRCNQPQVSDEVRFCSRCGFRLDAVAELLKHDGVLVPRSGQPSQSARRKRRTRQGAKMMFVSVFLLPFAIALSAEVDSPGPLLIPFTVFLIGLFWLLYFRFFGEDNEREADELYHPPQFGNASRDYALPPQQTVPAADFTSARHRTAEIVQPPSVTENTTKLLDQD